MTFYKRREKFSGFSEKIGSAFSHLPISPNQWTVISLLPVIASVYFLSKGAFIIAAILFIVSGFLDMVDGAVARKTGRTTKKGAYLDTIVDRYVEVIIIFGLLFASLPELLIPAYAWIFVYLFGGLMTTYSKAAAKEKELIEKGSELKGGILERAERLLLLFIGLLLASVNPLYLTGMLALLAVLTNVSALQRIGIALRKQESA
jgi:archaetidylinositol phosphate synthase